VLCRYSKDLRCVLLVWTRLLSFFYHSNKCNFPKLSTHSRTAHDPMLYLSFQLPAVCQTSHHSCPNHLYQSTKQISPRDTKYHNERPTQRHSSRLRPRKVPRSKVQGFYCFDQSCLIADSIGPTLFPRSPTVSHGGHVVGKWEFHHDGRDLKP
jgi:hypothetical protein